MRARSLERGQILPLVAICLAVLMGFAAMAIDVGFLEYRQRQQQNAADAAAIGGAQQLVYAGCVNQQATAQTAGDNDAASNGFANGSNGGAITVTINNPPDSGPYATNACAVQAIITNTHTQTFFSRLFGYPNGMQETTEAVAVTANTSPLCAVQLGPNGTPTFNGNKISAPGCSLEMNGSPVFHGGSVDFSNIGYAGSLTDHGTKWVEASPAPMLPVQDPCPEIPGCKELADNPPSTSNCGQYTGSAPQPGCYSSFNVTGGTLAPGLYVLTGTSSFGPAVGTGVTIYVAAGASPLDLSGVKGNLTACTTSCGGTGSYQAVPNVLYYQVPSNKNSLTWSGPQSTYSGMIYAPGADLTINGNGGSGYSLFVFNDWTINGTGQGMTFTAPPNNGSFPSQAVLVQ